MIKKTTLISATMLAAVAPSAASQTATASWFRDGGPTASGQHFRFGYASLAYGSRWGHRIRFCHRGHCVVGKMEDHGPYTGNRRFDLNERLKNALRCGDLCTVSYSDA
jgi:hypothetical protein